jgi:hypothetical protein
METITLGTNFNEFYANALQTILNRMETFEIRGSQWVLSRIIKVELKIKKFNPLRGSSYMPLPPNMANKKAIINVKNKKVTNVFYGQFFQQYIQQTKILKE